MGDLTKNFSRREFACTDGCGFDTVDYELVTILQDLADGLGDTYGEVEVKITGPNRCKAQNEAVGGAPNSTHLEAKADDFKVFIKKTKKQIDPDIVADLLNEWYPDSKGIGRYINRTHFDSRTTKARWDNREVYLG
jgi:hypothetical protein